MSKNYTNYNKINKLDNTLNEEIVNAPESIEESVNTQEVTEDISFNNVTTKRVANCARVYMRASADKNSNPIDVLGCGVEVRVLESENGFTHVDHDGVDGWIMNEYLIGD